MESGLQQLIEQGGDAQGNLERMQTKRRQDVEGIRSQALLKKQQLANVKAYVADVRAKLDCAKEQKTQEILVRQQTLLREVDNMCRMNVCEVELQERDKAAKIEQKIEQLTSWEHDLAGLIASLDKQVN